MWIVKSLTTERQGLFESTAMHWVTELRPRSQAQLNKDFWKTQAPANSSWLKVSLKAIRNEDRLTSVFDMSLLRPSYTQGNIRDKR